MLAMDQLHLETATRSYFRLLEALRHSVIATDPAGVITYWSDAAELLYGWSAEEVLGKQIIEVIATDISKVEAVSIMQSLSNGQVWSSTFAVRIRSGESLQAAVTDVPLLDENHSVVGIVGISAPLDEPSDVNATLLEFVAACNAVWPQRVRLTIRKNASSRVGSSPSHVLQLLSLLLARFIDRLESGSTVDLIMDSPAGSPFVDFHLVSTLDRGVYISITETNPQGGFGILRDGLHASAPTDYAATLVKMVNGMMMFGSSNARPAVHLLLRAPTA
ncbi:MAG: PAS domain-containing protein [Acidobacteriota bacterium]